MSGESGHQRAGQAAEVDAELFEADDDAGLLDDELSLDEPFEEPFDELPDELLEDDPVDDSLDDPLDDDSLEEEVDDDPSFCEGAIVDVEPPGLSARESVR
jgi:hypothetical protein